MTRTTIPVRLIGPHFSAYRTTPELRGEQRGGIRRVPLDPPGEVGKFANDGILSQDMWVAIEIRQITASAATATDLVGLLATRLSPRRR